MLVKKIIKNLILLRQGRLRPRDIPLKIRAYCLDNSLIARWMHRCGFPITEVICRNFQSQDLSLYREFMQLYFSDKSTPEEEIRPPVSNTDFIYYVALYNTKMVGVVGLEKAGQKDKPLWWLAGLSVLPTMRGYGIGEKLLRALIKSIGEQRPIIGLSVFKDNYRAMALYRKCGFRFSSEQDKHLIDESRYSPGKLIMVLDCALV